MKKNIALIFAGGTGNRMNSKGKPKQFLELNSKPIIIHTLDIFEQHRSIDDIIVVCHKDWIEYLRDILMKFNIHKVSIIVQGGTSGQQSIRNGLEAIASSYKEQSEIIVLIHDGVRPLITEQTITDNIECVLKYGNAITVTPAIETVVKTNSETEIEEIYDRSLCRLARAPQSFILKDILNAHRKFDVTEDLSIVDSATLMHKYGFKLHIVEGPVENIKITNPSDFYILRAILQAKENSQIWGL